MSGTTELDENDAVPPTVCDSAAKHLRNVSDPESRPDMANSTKSP